MTSIVESLPRGLVYHSQLQKSADTSVLADWETQAEKCRKVLRESLNPAWLLPPGKLPPADQLNISTFIETCGFLSARELEITATSATKLVEQMASGSLTAVKTVTVFLKRAYITHQLTNFTTEFISANALKAAAELDAYFKATGKIKGPLHGIPILTKEHICHKGRVTHSAYVALIDNIAKEDALIVQCCKKAGAVFHVRTNEPQSVMHIDCSSPIYGTTVNPHNRTLTCGGSSGGEGASLGLRCAALGIGTDLGGSVRVPAAFCGAYGLGTTALRNPYAGEDWLRYIHRRVKCDEAKPSCRNCSRFGRSCSWPSTSDMADKRHRRRRATPSSSPSASESTSPPEPTDETSHEMVPIMNNRAPLTTINHPLCETEIEFELVHHFYSFHFNSLTLPTKDKSYFFQCQSDLMDMMSHNKTVKYAILANCASNKHALMNNDRYRFIALSYCTEAMRGLNQELVDFCPSDAYRHSRPFRPEFRLESEFISHAEDLLRSYDDANPSSVKPNIVLRVPTSLYRLILRIIDSYNVPRTDLSDYLKSLKAELQYWEQLLFDDEDSQNVQNGDSSFNDLMIIATSLLFDLITETLTSSDDSIYHESSAGEEDGKPWRWQLNLAMNTLQCPEEYQKWSGCYLEVWPLLILGYGARSLEEITLVKEVLTRMQQRIGYGEVQRIRDELDDITTYKGSDACLRQEILG
ncbi:general amidase [Fusarium coicis]|nr:general amidase [Fusarium coicis]